MLLKTGGWMMEDEALSHPCGASSILTPSGEGRLRSSFPRGPHPLLLVKPGWSQVEVETSAEWEGGVRDSPARPLPAANRNPDAGLEGRKEAPAQGPGKPQAGLPAAPGQLFSDRLSHSRDNRQKPRNHDAPRAPSCHKVNPMQKRGSLPRDAEANLSRAQQHRLHRPGEGAGALWVTWDYGLGCPGPG